METKTNNITIKRLYNSYGYVNGYQIFPLSYSEKKYILQIKDKGLSGIPRYACKIYEYRAKANILTGHLGRNVFTKEDISTVAIDNSLLNMDAVLDDEPYFINYLPQIAKSLFKEWEDSDKIQVKGFLYAMYKYGRPLRRKASKGTDYISREYAKFCCKSLKGPEFTYK